MQTKFEITSKLLENSIEYSDTSYCDTDMNRTAEDHQIDSVIGELGERIGFKFFEQFQPSPEPPTSYSHDLTINGKLIEIKSRKRWAYSQLPDLLVRTKFDLVCDIYLQIDIFTEDDEPVQSDFSNLSHAEVIGFVTPEDIHELGEPFNSNYDEKENSTQIVHREHLRSPINLIGFV